MPWRSPVIPLVAALLSGGLLALCFPPWNHGGMVWLWIAPLLAVLWFWEPAEGLRRAWLFRQPRWVWAAVAGWAAGAVFFLTSFCWLRHVTWAGMILLCLYLALYFALWAAFAATAGRLRLASLQPPAAKPPGFEGKLVALRPAPATPAFPGAGLLGPSLHALRAAFLCAAAWVACEWLRGVVFTGFGWNGLGVALHDSPQLRQAADLVGVTGLSFLPAFCGAVGVATIARCLAESGRGRLSPHLDAALALVLVLATFLYGVRVKRAHPVEQPVELSGVIIQGNVPIEQRYNIDPARPASEIYEIYDKLTTLYANQGYDLLLWPETCLPATFFEPETQRFFNSILSKGGFQLLAGSDQVVLREDGAMDIFNSMVLMKGTTASYQAYHKMHLVPFGEFIPFRDSFPVFTWALGRLIPEDFDPGKEFKLLRLEQPGIDIIPSICFEDTIGRLTRRFLSTPPGGPQVIVNITNDSWFNRSPANAQHLANARFRTVELKRPMVRCANTGISCVIDEFGSLNDPNLAGSGRKRAFLDRKTGSPFVRGCFPFRLRVDSRPSTTIYARYGDWFPHLSILMTAAVGAVAIWSGARKRSR